MKKEAKKKSGCTVDLTEEQKRQIRTMMTHDPTQPLMDIWKAVGKPVSYPTIKRYVKSVWQEKENTEWKKFEVQLEEGYWLKGEPYFPAGAIAEWLELWIDEIDAILMTCPHIKKFSKEIDVEGSDRKERIFDMVGVQLIAMAVQTKKAVELQIAAAQFFVQGIHWKAEKVSKLDPQKVSE
jgi:hypothetical protein